MRSFPIAIALLLGGCKVVNPAFGDDGVGTSNEDGSASDTSTSGRPTSSSTTGSTGSTGRPGSGTQPDSTTPSSADASSGDTAKTTSESDTDTPSDPFRVEVVFPERPDESLIDFVARVEIHEPYLQGIPPTALDFREAGSDAQVPFEVIRYDPETGHLDAWVLLREWGTGNGPTIVELVVGYETPKPTSPWDAYEHVWHLDDDDVMLDATQASQGQFLGYGEGRGTVTGVAGRARLFDGDDDRAEVPSVAAPSMSVAAYGWARIDGFPDGQVPLFSRNDGPPSADDGADNGVDWAVTVDEAGLVGMVARVTGGPAMSTSGTAPPAPADGWHHYAVVSSTTDNRLRFYVDGISNQLILSSLFTGLSAASISMGAWTSEANPGGPRFQGALDEVTVLHRNVPQGWVRAVYDNQRTPTDSYELGPVQPD